MLLPKNIPGLGRSTEADNAVKETGMWKEDAENKCYRKEVELVERIKRVNWQFDAAALAAAEDVPRCTHIFTAAGRATLKVNLAKNSAAIFLANCTLSIDGTVIPLSAQEQKALAGFITALAIDADAEQIHAKRVQAATALEQIAALGGRE